MLKLFVAGAMLAAVCGPKPPGPGEEDPRDVTGNYAIAYDNQLRVQVNLGGALREVTQSGYGGITDFGIYNGMPVQIDLQELRIIDDENHNPPAGKKAPSVTGLVNHDDVDRFIVGLGFQAGASGACAAVDVSFASGRFSHAGERSTTTMKYRSDDGRACSSDAGMPASDAGAGADAGMPKPCMLRPVTVITWDAGAAVDGIKEGRVGFAWAGAARSGRCSPARRCTSRPATAARAPATSIRRRSLPRRWCFRTGVSPTTQGFLTAGKRIHAGRLMTKIPPSRSCSDK